jgi:cytochrome c oxidase subunit 2
VKERTIFFLTIATLALFGLGVAAASGLNLMPEQASARSQVVDQLFRVMIGVATFIFLLVEGALLYAVFRFRARAEDEGDAAPVHGNTSLEVVWTLIPAVIVVVIGVYSFRVLTKIEEPQPNEMVIEVIGRQFAWEFRYPSEAGLSSSELHLVVDRPARFQITSEDVIHSFYIPAFRAKRDATPGQVSDLAITPTELGRFPIRCAELCGAGHANMLSEAVVETEEDFRAWVDGFSVLPSDPIEAGRFVFEKYGCGACHTLSDAGSESTVGPVMDGLSGRLGERIPGLDSQQYVMQSIVDPSGYLVEGFQDSLMPKDFGDRMNTVELEVLVDYLLEQ